MRNCVEDTRNGAVGARMEMDGPKGARIKRDGFKGHMYGYEGERDSAEG